MVAFKKDRISEDKQRVSLLINKDTYAQVKELAAANGISANEFMTRAIELSMSCRELSLADIQRQVDAAEQQINEIKLQLRAFAKTNV